MDTGQGGVVPLAHSKVANQGKLETATECGDGNGGLILVLVLIMRRQAPERTSPPPGPARNIHLCPCLTSTVMPLRRYGLSYPTRGGASRGLFLPLLWAIPAML